MFDIIYIPTMYFASILALSESIYPFIALLFSFSILWSLIFKLAYGRISKLSFIKGYFISLPSFTYFYWLYIYNMLLNSHKINYLLIISISIIFIFLSTLMYRTADKNEVKTTKRYFLTTLVLYLLSIPFWLYMFFLIFMAAGV